jgi:hypothetical protein
MKHVLLTIICLCFLPLAHAKLSKCSYHSLDEAKDLIEDYDVYVSFNYGIEIPAKTRTGHSQKEYIDELVSWSTVQVQMKKKSSEFRILPVAQKMLIEDIEDDGTIVMPKDSAIDRIFSGNYYLLRYRMQTEYFKLSKQIVISCMPKKN